MIKFIKKLNMKFQYESLESEYESIRNKNQIMDFQVILLVLVLITSVTLIKALTTLAVTDIAITSGTIGALFVIFLMKRCLPKYINYLVFLSIFCYNLYRLSYMVVVIDKLTKTILFNSGYTYAVLQMILFSRIQNSYQRISVIVLCFILRFAAIIGFIEKSAFDIPTLARHAILDAFLIYYFYSQEKTNRQVFRDFSYERDELRTFKELVEEYLPECVLVISVKTNELLFSNKSYQNVFKYCTTEDTSANSDGKSEQCIIDIGPPKIPCSQLRVDSATIRELGTTNKDYFSLGLSGTLRNVTQTLMKNGRLTDHAFSMTGYYDILGETRSFEVILKRISWNRNDSIAVVFNDTTDQQRLLALKLANQNKDKIIATVSHELRTPLNGIIGLLDMAEEKVVHPEAINYISHSKDNARLLLSLVNSHLDLQQISAGKLRLNPARIDIAKILNDVIQLLQFQTKQKGIYLEADISKGIPKTIITDENRLKQILINLIGNALKFTTKGGIKIEIRQDKTDEKCLEMSVVDTGMGIKDEDKGKLFQMYGRLEDGRSVNKNGVGLGLIISNVLAILLSGRTDERGIEVESTSGVGSRFYFKIRKDLQSIMDSETKEGVKRKTLLNLDQSEELLDFDCDEFALPGKSDKSVSSACFEGKFQPLNLHLKISTYVSTKKIDLQTINSKQSIGRHQTMERNRTNDAENNGSNSDIKEAAILVVDDNPFNLLVVQNLIKNMGIPLKSALSGHEAIEMVKSCAQKGESIKVILMDCEMPIMDGFETSQVLTKMMEKGDIPSTPIVALTAGISEEDRKKGLKCGMKGCLTKPLTKTSLLNELNKYNNSV